MPPISHEVEHAVTETLAQLLEFPRLQDILKDSLIYNAFQAQHRKRLSGSRLIIQTHTWKKALVSEFMSSETRVHLLIAEIFHLNS